MIECLLGIVSPKTFGRVVFITSEPSLCLTLTVLQLAVVQAGLRLNSNFPSSVIQVLGLQVYVTMPRFYPSFAVCLAFTHTQKPKFVGLLFMDRNFS